MAPAFAPNHVANVKALSREGYFVNGAVTRVQDAGDRFTRLPDPDTYATEVGFIDGMPVARDATTQWIAHCYGVWVLAAKTARIQAVAPSCTPSSANRRATSTASSAFSAA